MLKKQDLGINPYVANNGSRDQSLTGIGGPRVYVILAGKWFLRPSNSPCLMDPRSTLVGKHSLRVAVSVEDLLHEYRRHASPLRQVWDWVALVASNLSQVLSGLSRLPHE